MQARVLTVLSGDKQFAQMDSIGLADFLAPKLVYYQTTGEQLVNNK